MVPIVFVSSPGCNSAQKVPLDWGQIRPLVHLNSRLFGTFHVGEFPSWKLSRAKKDQNKATLTSEFLRYFRERGETRMNYEMYIYIYVCTLLYTNTQNNLYNESKIFFLFLYCKYNLELWLLKWKTILTLFSMCI